MRARATAGTPNPSTLSTPFPTGCPGELPATPLRVTDSSQVIAVDLLGSGSATVVLSNQSDEDRCSWTTFATVLVSQGFRVALWDYAGAPAPDELAAVARAVHDGGVSAVILMGASKGAKTALVVARSLDAPYIAGVVSLSAEAILRPNVDVARAAKGLSAPTLLVTAAADPYGSAEALGPIQAGLAHAKTLTVPGRQHGTALLADPAVSAAVLAFLHQVAG